MQRAKNNRQIHNRMKREKFYLIGSLMVVLLGGIIFYINGQEALRIKKNIAKSELTSCLSSKNIKFYGSSDCLNCKVQKDILGEAFSWIDYIECKKENGIAKICLDNEINTVPVWSFPSGLGIKKKLSSCQECVKKSKKIKCNNYCYEASRGEFRVAGTISLEKLVELSDCVADKNK